MLEHMPSGRAPSTGSPLTLIAPFSIGRKPPIRRARSTAQPTADSAREFPAGLSEMSSSARRASARRPVDVGHLVDGDLWLDVRLSAAVLVDEGFG